MVLAKTGICEFGWKARDFALRGVDGKTYTLADVRGRKGTQPLSEQEWAEQHTSKAAARYESLGEHC
jgi:hypothetical protein